MTHRTVATTSFVALLSLTAPSYAAVPEFKAGLITESRTLEREELRRGGPVAHYVPVRVSINRVTVALDSELITGEWKPGPFPRGFRVEARHLVESFPAGADVEVATSANQLLLRHPDGGVVRARIVDRAPVEERESD